MYSLHKCHKYQPSGSRFLLFGGGGGGGEGERKLGMLHIYTQFLFLVIF